MRMKRYLDERKIVYLFNKNLKNKFAKILIKPPKTTLNEFNFLHFFNAFNAFNILLIHSMHYCNAIPLFPANSQKPRRNHIFWGIK